MLRSTGNSSLYSTMSDEITKNICVDISQTADDALQEPQKNDQLLIVHLI